MKTLKLILSLAIVTIVASCNGGLGKASQTNGVIGKIVADIDKNIRVIYQDTKNNYWFGSDGNGVYLYNGKTIEQITSDHGLIHNQIRGIQEDKYGHVYIETPAGINKFDGHQLTALTPTASPSNNWKLEPDDLWFNCNGSLKDVYRYDGKSLTELKLPLPDLEKAFGFTAVQLENTNPTTVFGIDKDKNGNIWFGTSIAGAFRYNGASFLWIGEQELTMLEDGRVPGVRSMIQDKNGDFWLSNMISRYQISPDSKHKYKKIKGIDYSKSNPKLDLPYFMSAVTDKENKDLWMLTYSKGVWRYDGNILGNYQVKDGNLSALLVSIYEDNQGTIWLATQNAGVFKFNGKTFEKFTFD